MGIEEGRQAMTLQIAQLALVAGCLIGLLDVGMASLINFASPAIVLKAIAGGVLGKPAFDGGAATVLLGLVLQVAMSAIIAALYFMAARYAPKLADQPWLFGAAYGVAIFLVMNFIVVPLSALHHLPKITPYWVAANGLAMIVFGLLVALAARWAVRA